MDLTSFFKGWASHDCCETIEIFYTTLTQEYTHTRLYGFYEKQSYPINGRSWYQSQFGRSIWWDGYDDWFVGKNVKVGKSKGYAYVKTNETCLPNNGNWIISNGSGDGSWYDAGNQLKVQCGKPKSIEGMVYYSNFICCHMKI